MYSRIEGKEKKSICNKNKCLDMGCGRGCFFYPGSTGDGLCTSGVEG